MRWENLESRLALTWSGTPPISIEPPLDAVEVFVNAEATATGNATIATTEIDYYAFTPPLSGPYVISTSTPSSNVDTVLGVFSDTGARLAFNDDIIQDRNTDSRLTINLDAEATYFIGITNYWRSVRGTYKWSIVGTGSASGDDNYEQNDSRAAAANLGTVTTGKTVGSLILNDTQDWFKFTTVAKGTVTSAVAINFQNANGDLQLKLYSSTGTVLATSNGSGNAEVVSLNGRAAGTYFVQVTGNNGDRNPNYTLVVTPPGATTTANSFQITLNMTGLTASQQTIFRNAANRWSQVIVADLPNANFQGLAVDDLLINASAVAIDGPSGILGQATFDAVRPGTFLPYHGFMEFDTSDLAVMEQSGVLFSVVLHEMGHVLGIGSLWEDLGLLSGAGTNNPTFTGAQATAAYNQIFGTNSRGVPVEAGGGAGTALSHWRETILTNELMTGYAGPGTILPLSTITIGSLADIGYTVNYSAADSFTALSAGSIATSGGGSSSSFAALRLGEPSLGLPSDPIASVMMLDSLRSTSASANTIRTATELRAAFVDQALSRDLETTAGEPGMSRVDRRLDSTRADLCQTIDEAFGELAFDSLRLN